MPQGLCSCCFLCLECSSLDWLLLIIPIFLHTPTPHGSSLTALHRLPSRPGTPPQWTVFITLILSEKCFPIYVCLIYSFHFPQKHKLYKSGECVLSNATHPPRTSPVHGSDAINTGWISSSTIQMTAESHPRATAEPLSAPSCCPIKAQWPWPTSTPIPDTPRGWK